MLIAGVVVRIASLVMMIQYGVLPVSVLVMLTLQGLFRWVSAVRLFADRRVSKGSFSNGIVGTGRC